MQTQEKKQFRDYRIMINVDADLIDPELYLFVCSVTDILRLKLDKEFKELPFKAEYHISFSRKA